MFMGKKGLLPCSGSTICPKANSKVKRQMGGFDGGVRLLSFSQLP
jgi:hypothetical protein